LHYELLSSKEYSCILPSPLVHSNNAAETLYETIAISVVGENWLAVNPTSNDMMKPPGGICP
jgi:hypothetical protein